MRKILSLILSVVICILYPVTAFADTETYTEDLSFYEDTTYTEKENFSFNMMEFFSEWTKFETPEVLNRMSRVSKVFFLILATFIIVYMAYKMYKGSKLEEKINNYKENKKKISSNTDMKNINQIKDGQAEERGSNKDE